MQVLLCYLLDCDGDHPLQLTQNMQGGDPGVAPRHVRKEAQLQCCVQCVSVQDDRVVPRTWQRCMSVCKLLLHVHVDVCQGAASPPQQVRSSPCKAGSASKS